jgi:hypothetical protein
MRQQQGGSIMVPGRWEPRSTRGAVLLRMLVVLYLTRPVMPLIMSVMLLAKPVME